MKKGEFITLCILRLIAIAIGIIHLFFNMCIIMCIDIGNRYDCTY